MSVMCRCLVSQPGVWVAARWSLLWPLNLERISFAVWPYAVPLGRILSCSRPRRDDLPHGYVALAPSPHTLQKYAPHPFQCPPLPSRLFSPCPFRLSLPQSLSLDSPSLFHSRLTPPQLVDREPPSPSTSRSSTRTALDWVGSHCIASHCTGLDWIDSACTRAGLGCTGSPLLHPYRRRTAPHRTAPHRTPTVTCSPP